MNAAHPDAATVTPELEASYTAIIDDLLANCDLETVSIRRIRKDLEARTGKDLSELKDAIAKLIGLRFDIAAVTEPVSIQKVSSPPSLQAKHPKIKAESPACSTPAAKPPKTETPSKPRVRKETKREPTETSDAALAARLQAEENTRYTRPSRSSAAAPKRRSKVISKSKSSVKRQKGPKSSTKVHASDDSSLSGSSDNECTSSPAKQPTGAFHKLQHLSPALSELLGGETELSRPQTVKKIWEYVKERDLQDPADRRQIRCDEALKAVFKTEKVHMFTMNKLLSNNLHPVDE